MEAAVVSDDGAADQDTLLDEVVGHRELLRRGLCRGHRELETGDGEFGAHHGLRRLGAAGGGLGTHRGMAIAGGCAGAVGAAPLVAAPVVFRLRRCVFHPCGFDVGFAGQVGNIIVLRRCEGVGDIPLPVR